MGSLGYARLKPSRYGRAQFLALCVLLGLRGSAIAPVPFTTIDRGQQSNLDEPRQIVVRTAAEWTKLWNQHAGEGRDKPPIDFTKSTVIGVFMGSRPTGGYATDITAIEKEGTELTVNYKEQNPAPRAMLSQALTMPFHLVKIDRHTGAVKFKKG